MAASLTFVTFMYMTGIPISTNLTGLSYLDLDVRDVRLALTQQAFPNFTKATQIYTQGSGNAYEIVNGVYTPLTLQNIYEDITGEKYFNMYSSYYLSKTYANDFIMEALGGTGRFDSQSVTIRQAAALDGIIYLDLFMKVIVELYEAMESCTPGTPQSSMDVESAWAFYTGSLQNTVTTEGEMLFEAANGLCDFFNTCGAELVANVNGQVTALITQGQSLERFALCGSLDQLKTSVVAQMTVTLTQGLLVSSFYADPSNENANMINYWGKAYTYGAAILPLVNYCSPSAATIIQNNVNINQAQPMQNGGFAAVYSAVQSVFPCLNITCAAVGAPGFASLPVCTDSTAATTFVPTTSTAPPATMPINPTTEAWLVVLVVFLIAFYVVSLCVTYRCAKRDAVNQIEGIGMKPIRVANRRPDTDNVETV